jgi:hypothetical protein
MQAGARAQDAWQHALDLMQLSLILSSTKDYDLSLAYQHKPLRNSRSCLWTKSSAAAAFNREILPWW